ncbi:MAG: hypothetical protein DI533_10635 [Cereibacter sphaeroides]|uniref:Uncharacterized protein n=1 Tax=Cereibacter sphaeroides TaxID=1063 RepID=A0A2W5TPF4_CERSP|nr:MAG: hypothetical protein DI533_10635 [Cereibacter sphaeroides]
MTQAIQTEGAFRIHLLAASPAASLAILSIASVLGIGSQQAADRLASLPSVLADDVPGPEARRLSALLTALGLLVRLDPTFSTVASVAADPLLEMSIRVDDRDDRPAAVAHLVQILGRAESDVDIALNSPEGLVLQALNAQSAVDLRQEFRRDRSLRLTVADPAISVYDAFPRPGAALPAGELLRLGLGKCRFSGAVATAMNHATARHLKRRVSDRLIILNREFQRYDLFVSTVPSRANKELADFLDSRPGANRAASPDALRRIETDLTHRVAVQFVADYAAIGLDVQPRLRGMPAAEIN